MLPTGSSSPKGTSRWCATASTTTWPTTGCQAKLAEALEKVLKAALVGLGWPLVVKTHNLMLLADELSVRDAGLESAARPLCEALAEYYLGTRYPGFDLDDPDWPVLRLQLEAITALAASVRARLKVS